jgi:hypothetical protein
MSAYALFGLLERTKIAAFSTDSFIKSGADAKGVTLWNELTSCCNQLVLQEIKKTDVLIFSRYLFDLDQARIYILETIKALHTGHNPRTSALAQKHLLKVYTLEDECFTEIRKNSKPSKDWISQIPHAPILTNSHKLILDGYIYIAQQAEHDGHPVTAQELEGLLKLHGFLDKKLVKNLIDNLEQYCYKKEKHRKIVRQLIKELSELYPEILSTYDLSILANTKDKAHLIIFAQAGAYENILHQILRELIY